MIMFFFTLGLILFSGSAFAGILINEINVEIPESKTGQFVELYNNGDTPVVLTNYKLAFIDSDERVYEVYDLAGVTINDYYVLGHSDVNNVDRIFNKAGTETPEVQRVLDKGPDAVVLYYGSMIKVGDHVTRANVVDAVVYDNGGRNDIGLLNMLTPGQSTVHEDSDFLMADDETMSRCGGSRQADNYQFTLSVPSPGEANKCPEEFVPPTGLPRVKADGPTEVIINEVEADNVKTDAKEFIELYNTASREIKLDKYVVILYDGNRATPSAYTVIGLKNHSIPAKGYFVLGSESVPGADFKLARKTNNLRNGPAGVALYYGDPQLYSVGSTVTGVGLVDALVYTSTEGGKKNLGGRRMQSFLASIATGEGFVFEDSKAGDVSMSRCFFTKAFQSSSYLLVTPTPGKSNNCYAHPDPKQIIIG